jgi:hypothetical protein
MNEMQPDARVRAGHGGLVGSAVLRLEREGAAASSRPREQLDLRDQAAVNYWFRANRPSTCSGGGHRRRHLALTLAEFISTL